MNCPARVSLYSLLVNIFFVHDKAWTMFFISTATFLLALIVAWVISRTVLRRETTAPFVMEMPTHHMPAVIVFFMLYPPCLASTIMVKVQTGSYKWMLFAILLPTGVGLAVLSARAKRSFAGLRWIIRRPLRDLP